MTAHPSPDAAGGGPPSASFTIVTSGLDEPPAALVERAGPDRGGDRRRQAAWASVASSRVTVFAAIVCGIVGLGVAEARFGDLARSVGAMVCLVVAGGASHALRLTRADTPLGRAGARHWRQPIAAAAVLAGVALAPWALHFGAWDAEPIVAAAVVVALALFCTLGFAPVGPLAALAVALPLSAALAVMTARGVDGAVAGRVGWSCILGSAACALFAVAEQHRWRAAARERFDADDRIVALEAARDAAIRADQEKSRFLAIASHDLRQPVHAIGLFAATLEKRLAGSAEEPLVRNLNRAIDGLDRSFNVMLDISRLDAGAIEPRVRHFPLRDLFRRLHMHFAGQAEQKGLGLRFSPGGKSVSSDPQLLERVLGNLVQNAIKYTERGGIVVVARSTATRVNVEIWDTGVGVRVADLSKIFDEFYQVGRGERVRAQGLGMGLAIVKRLVRLLGHELTVTSRPGHGTMFRLGIAIGGLPDIQDVTAAADTLPMPLLQPRTVLVLDDEEPIREGLVLLLEEWGYDAVAAGSIDEAVAAVDQLDAPPDLILSDLHLGEGPDGIAAIEAIRRRCGSEVAAMLITGDTSHAEIRRATESGHHVLFKPVQPRKLYDALRGLAS